MCKKEIWPVYGRDDDVRARLLEVGDRPRQAVVEHRPRRVVGDAGARRIGEPDDLSGRVVEFGLLGSLGTLIEASSEPSAIGEQTRRKIQAGCELGDPEIGRVHAGVAADGGWEEVNNRRSSSLSSDPRKCA